MSNPGERKLQGSTTSSQSRHMHNKGKQGTNVAHNIMGGLQIIAMFHL